MKWYARRITRERNSGNCQRTCIFVMHRRERVVIFVVLNLRYSTTSRTSRDIAAAIAQVSGCHDSNVSATCARLRTQCPRGWTWPQPRTSAEISYATPPTRLMEQRRRDWDGQPRESPWYPRKTTSAGLRPWCATVAAHRCEWALLRSRHWGSWCPSILY